MSFTTFMLISITLSTCRADVPDAIQMCEYDASARCKMNNIISVLQSPCPKTSETIKPFEIKDCHDPKQNPYLSVRPTVTPNSVPAHPVRIPTQPNKWLPLLGLLTVFFFIISIRRNIKKSERYSNLRHWITGTITFFLSLGVGLGVARYFFYKSFDLIQNKDGLFPALAGLAAGIVGFTIGMGLTLSIVTVVLKNKK